MSTVSGRIHSQSQPRRQRPRSAPRKAGNRAPSPMLWLHCFRLRFRIDQSRLCGCREFRTIAGPDFRALRKARLRRKTFCFHSPGRRCAWPCRPTLNDAAVDGNYAATLKSRADHTDRVLASQDCVITVYIIDFTWVIRTKSPRLWSSRRTAAAGMSVTRLAAIWRVGPEAETSLAAVSAPACGAVPGGHIEVQPRAYSSRR